MTEINKPALIISLLFSISVEKAIAFGGVETGKTIAKEHDNATTVASIIVFSPGITITIGIRRFAVAVLLINVDNKTAKTQNIATRTNPSC